MQENIAMALDFMGSASTRNYMVSWDETCFKSGHDLVARRCRFFLMYLIMMRGH